MVDPVESEPFSTAESRQQPNLGPNWSNLPLPVMRTECVDERIGDFASTEIAPDHFLIADNAGKRVGSAWEERPSLRVQSWCVSGERTLLYMAGHTFYVILTTGRSADEGSAQKGV
jgi:hypothetical protein